MFGEIHKVRKGLWAFFLDCCLDADWLNRQANSDHIEVDFLWRFSYI